MATTSGTAVKLKRLRQRFGISAPKLAIRTHVAWYWRVLTVITILAVFLMAAAWIYDEGMRIAGFHSDESSREIQSLRDHLMELDVELTKLRSLAGSGESSLQIERATQKQLSWQVKALEAENAALKEDLAFFEGLMPTSDVVDEAAIRIDHLRIEPDGVADEYRYRMLVINNAGRQAKELKGALQLVVKVRQNDKDVMLTLPSDSEKNSQRFRFEIKHFHRIEGVFSVPKGAVVKVVEARLLQDGVVRAKQSVIL
jgi:hypothetical protein